MAALKPQGQVLLDSPALTLQVVFLLYSAAQFCCPTLDLSSPALKPQGRVLLDSPALALLVAALIWLSVWLSAYFSLFLCQAPRPGPAGLSPTFGSRVSPGRAILYSATSLC